jgi:succinate dehydrogenase / fumarate reductase, flavoprotein subunit
LRAGCRVMDMELVQFHPTGMLWPEEAAGTLVTEAVRAEGGRLFNARGERFMERYDPARLELSSRDRVALASYTEIAAGRGGPHGGVFLDVTHLGKERVVDRLPRMYRQFIEYEMVDIATEPMEVAPTAHYSRGGIVVEPDTGATDLAGLYAAGECAAGLHGANRLGGNSLAETVVFGRRAGEAAARSSLACEAPVRSNDAIDEARDELDGLVRHGAAMGRQLQREIRDAMWRLCGVTRDETGLGKALRVLEQVRSRLAEVDVRPTGEGWSDLVHALDLRAMLGTAEATVAAALARTETRGAHNRIDHPELDEGLTVNLICALDTDGRLTVTQRPVPPIADELRSSLAVTPDEPGGGLLE